MRFTWDEGKRLWLIEDRSIDFEDLKLLFDGRPLLTYPSPRGDEARFISVGEIADRMFAVVWMWRDDEVRLITARRAWKSEERLFRDLAGDERK